MPHLRDAALFGAACCLMALMAACATPVKSMESPESTLRAIQAAEDRRDAADPAIERGLGQQQTYLRQAALVALARIGRAGTSSLAARLINDPDEDVARWAVFALERIADPEAEAVLRAAVYVSPTPDQVLLALGRSATATVAPVLGEHLQDKRQSVRAAAALGLGVLLKRHGKDVLVSPYSGRLAELAKKGPRQVRYGAVYALARSTEAKASVALVRALADEDPEIRAVAAAGLGRSQSRPGVLDLVTNDRDWRVRTAAVVALGRLGSTEENASPSATRLEAMADRAWARLARGGRIEAGRAMHELLAVVEALRGLGQSGVRLLKKLEAKPWTSAQNLPPGAAPDVARLACALAKADDLSKKQPRKVRSCGRGQVPEWRRLEMVAQVHAANGSSASVEALKRLAAHQDSKVRLAAVASLSEVESAEATAALLSLLRVDDLYMITAAAEGLSRPSHIQRAPKRVPIALDHALAKVASEADASLVVAAIEAAAKPTPMTESVQAGLRRLLSDPRHAVRRRAAAVLAKAHGGSAAFSGRQGPALTAMPPGARNRVDLIFETERGVVALQLLPEAAPVHVAVWTQLANSGAYDGRSFHRVVSGFVAQGGCPRGDGWGGPGYALPDEVTPLPFLRGTVGVATNGRDTGGSQLFVMHAWHPHLDGRYTWVGRVIDGIEVIDAIQQDDRIISVRVEEDIR